MGQLQKIKSNSLRMCGSHIVFEKTKPFFQVARQHLFETLLPELSKSSNLIRTKEIIRRRLGRLHGLVNNGLRLNSEKRSFEQCLLDASNCPPNWYQLQRQIFYCAMTPWCPFCWIDRIWGSAFQKLEKVYLGESLEARTRRTLLFRSDELFDIQAGLAACQPVKSPTARLTPFLPMLRQLKIPRRPSVDVLLIQYAHPFYLNKEFKLLKNYRLLLLLPHKTSIPDKIAHKCTIFEPPKTEKDILAILKIFCRYPKELLYSVSADTLQTELKIFVELYNQPIQATISTQGIFRNTSQDIAEDTLIVPVADKRRVVLPLQQFSGKEPINHDTYE